ncbi:hypothetical protein D3C78_1445240 [compost metagenome]
MRRTGWEVITSTAASGSSGMASSWASTLIVPWGTMPRGVSASTSACTTSLMVPSPPIATITSAPWASPKRAASVPSPAQRVATVATDQPLARKRSRMASIGTCFLARPEPATGL